MLGKRRVRGWFPRRCAIEVMNGNHEPVVEEAPSELTEVDQTLLKRTTKKKDDWCRSLLHNYNAIFPKDLFCLRDLLAESKENVYDKWFVILYRICMNGLKSLLV